MGTLRHPPGLNGFLDDHGCDSGKAKRKESFPSLFVEVYEKIMEDLFI